MLTTTGRRGISALSNGRKVRAMLQRVEISAVLQGDQRRHPVRWERAMELSLDCFVCERLDRTMFLEWGAERARCTADERHGRHFAPVRIAAFESTVGEERAGMRAVVEYWWAPFHDAKRDAASSPLAEHPWVRLNFGYACERRGDRHVWSSTTQTNLLRPVSAKCGHCGDVAVTSLEAPVIRLVS
jgi:hypothetical protein